VSHVQDTRLVRTCVDGRDHALVLQQSPDEASRFGPLFDLLPADGPADVLVVTYRHSEQFFREWRDRVDSRPRNVGVLSVGERTRSAAANVPTPVERTPLDAVADPTDTDGIRRATERYLDGWPTDGRAVVYLDSVTALADYLDEAGVVGFVERLCEALDDRGAAGYFAIRPAAHDPRVVRRVASRFDTVVERTPVETEPTRPSVDDCLDAMADARRRHLLAALADGETVPVADLAERVAAEASADPESAHVSLVNVHLPKLADFGIVAYDRDDGLVGPGVHFERVVPFLRAAGDVDATIET
jgi:predicted transcriptional regulator